MLAAGVGSTPLVFQGSSNDVASDRSGLSHTTRLLGHFSPNFFLSFIHLLLFCYLNIFWLRTKIGVKTGY